MMEHNGNIPARASTDERASPSTPAVDDRALGPPDGPQFASEAEQRAWWAGVSHGLRSVGGDEPGGAVPPSGPDGPRLREDGWLPWKKARFLETLAAGGAVADACSAAGMSVASAYALRNRRSGRAFAAMWEAVLIHRARARLVDNNLSRAMDGWVEQIVRDGIVVAERRRFDNRLSMAMLTRLDRLAESQSGEEAELLRALSEDFEDYLEVVESGGDEDAFLEARRPEPDAAGAAPPDEAIAGPRLDGPAALEPRDWSLADPAEIPVDGLDPDRLPQWSTDERRRAQFSRYLDWLDMILTGDGEVPRGPDCPAAFDRYRRERPAERAAVEEKEAEAERLNSAPAFPGGE